ncbi:MAG: transposase [Proteobacteria bacterium]|nr:transposase [Pseudomonadota bacterium]
MGSPGDPDHQPGLGLLCLRRAIRYGLRPPLSQKRLSLTPDAKVRLKLRKPLASGRTDLLFEPVSFLRRLAAAIPRPRQNMLRFHGLFAPNARARTAVAALVDSQQRPSLQQQPGAVPLALAGNAVQTDDPKPVPKPYRRPWAELLAHVLDHDVLCCPRCGDRMVPVQTVKDPAVIQTILSHLGLPATVPTTSSSRGPPQQAFDFDQSPDDEIFDIPFATDA